MSHPPDPPGHPGQLPEYPGQSPEQRLESARAWAARGEPSAPGLSGAAGQMTERLQTVIEAAERAADAIRFDAEDQARRHLIEAQQKADRLTAERVRLISQLTDDLIEHASVVKHHSEEMVGALERAINTVSVELEQLDAGGHGGGHPAAGYSDDRGTQVTLPAAGEAGGRTPPLPAAALLRATQLAVSGASRESIAETLRQEFGIDPEPVLAQVLD